MRTSTIAAEFIKLGHDVLYVGNIDPIGVIDERLQSLGLSNSVIAQSHFQPNKASDVLLIDSYYMDPNTSFLEKKRWFKTVSICDAVTPNYDVDLVVKPSLSNRISGSSSVKVLTGPKYLLIRETISKTISSSLDGASPLKILIAGGGSDPSGFCSALTRVLITFPDQFILNVFADNFDTALLSDPRVKLFQVSSDIDRYATTSHLALTLASSLSLELLAAELPLGVAAGFENQVDGLKEILKRKLAVKIGIRKEQGAWAFDESNLRELVTSKSLRNFLREQSSGLIDLKGPYRVTQEILAL